MGSLEGHLLPATFILCFGIWWSYAFFNRYFQALVNFSLTRTRLYFECSATYSHLEGWLKMVMTLMGIIAEFYTALDNDLNFTHIGNSQHITMYIFFFIDGAVDVLVDYGYPLPKGSQYLTLSLGIAIESLLFCFHLNGRTALDIHVHTLLIISGMTAFFSVLIEWRFRRNALSALFRLVCTLLHGFWFFTIGFILYPPFSSRPVDESHRKIMLLTSVFCWEIAAILLVLLFTGFCFYCKNRRILQKREFLSTNCFSDNDYKNLINESKGNESEEQFTQIKTNSSKLLKYSTISTSDEEI